MIEEPRFISQPSMTGKSAERPLAAATDRPAEGDLLPCFLCWALPPEPSPPPVPLPMPPPLRSSSLASLKWPPCSFPASTVCNKEEGKDAEPPRESERTLSPLPPALLPAALAAPVPALLGLLLSCLSSCCWKAMTASIALLYRGSVSASAAGSLQRYTFLLFCTAAEMPEGTTAAASPPAPPPPPPKLADNKLEKLCLREFTPPLPLAPLPLPLRPAAGAARTSKLVKKGCLRHSAAVGRAAGSFCSILCRRSRHPSSAFRPSASAARCMGRGRRGSF